MVYDQELHRSQYHGLYGEQERHPTEHTQEDWALNTPSFNFPIKILSRADSRRHLARDNSYKKRLFSLFISRLFCGCSRYIYLSRKSRERVGSAYANIANSNDFSLNRWPVNRAWKIFVQTRCTFFVAWDFFKQYGHRFCFPGIPEQFPCDRFCFPEFQGRFFGHRFCFPEFQAWFPDDRFCFPEFQGRFFDDRFILSKFRVLSQVRMLTRAFRPSWHLHEKLCQISFSKHCVRGRRGQYFTPKTKRKGMCCCIPRNKKNNNKSKYTQPRQKRNREHPLLGMPPQWKN